VLYPDTVEGEKRVHKPLFVGGLFAVAFVLFFALDLTGTVFGVNRRKAGFMVALP